MNNIIGNLTAVLIDLLPEWHYTPGEVAEYAALQAIALSGITGISLVTLFGDPTPRLHPVNLPPVTGALRKGHTPHTYYIDYGKFAFDVIREGANGWRGTDGDSILVKGYTRREVLEKLWVTVALHQIAEILPRPNVVNPGHERVIRLIDQAGFAETVGQHFDYREALEEATAILRSVPRWF